MQRAQIVLSWAKGEFHTVIAQRLGISHVTVGKWCRRFTARASMVPVVQPAAPSPTAFQDLQRSLLCG
ncbi:MAG: helix-turn-helix domain-containing protein [Synechococcus sp. SB0678_bin_12]|nr:helix-turn-helix domain-containing protein [Synechococcus sp. SB0678_bin_12]MYI87660.1 helix-turn-helix domain-containing protein [Synechococcus sp. SB0672_bin_10]